jgi:hypothetical protein
MSAQKDLQSEARELLTNLAADHGIARCENCIRGTTLNGDGSVEATMTFPCCRGQLAAVVSSDKKQGLVLTVRRWKPPEHRDELAEERATEDRQRSGVRASSAPPAPDALAASH